MSYRNEFIKLECLGSMARQWGRDLEARGLSGMPPKHIIVYSLDRLKVVILLTSQHWWGQKIIKEVSL